MEISGSAFLVTGGASFIGSHIVDALLARGATRVRALDNLSFGTLDNLATALDDSRLQFVNGDVLEPADLAAATEGIEGLFHVAGVVTRPLGEEPEHGLAVNIHGTAGVLAAACAAGARKVVLSSSVSVYGAARGLEISEETSFDHGGWPLANTLYGSSKIIAERLCRLYYERDGLNYVALRYPTVYGRRQHPYGLSTKLIVDAWSSIASGEPPCLVGSGSRAHDYTYVTDVAAANLRAMETDVTGEAFNISTGVSTSERELVEVLLRLAGSSLTPMHQGDSEPSALGKSEALSYSSAKARRQLKWSAQVSVVDGVERLVRTLPGSAV